MTLPGFLDDLFSSRFMPHGHCYLWTPGLVWLHAISDGLVALSYTSIPFTLFFFQRRRRDLPFNWMFLCFATFIIACGATHYMEIWTLWSGTYWLSGVIKAVTALASVPTAFLLVRLLPRALAIPHPAELRDAYAALRESEARFRAALDGSLDAFFLLEAVRDDAGRIADFVVVETNARGERVLGVGRSAIVGRPISALFPEAQARELLPRYRQVVESRAAAGEELRLEGAGWWEHQLVPVEDGLAVTLRDIAPRKAAEQELKDSEERFRGLLEAAPDAMVITDAAGKIALVNAQAEELFGWTRAEIVGRPIEALVPRRFAEVHTVHRAQFAAERNRRPMGAGLDLVAVKRDGGEFPVEISLAPLESRGERYVTATIRDVTDRKRVELQIKSSLREKEVLLKEVHHRVKNNLQVISSLLNLQAANVKDPEALEMFRESQDRVRSIAFFHEHLYQSRDLARVDLGAYLKTLAASLLASYGQRRAGVSIRVAADGILLGVDQAIPCGLIVNELVSNALKHGFADGERGAVVVELAPSPVDRSRLVLAVADDGAGLPPGYEARDARTLGHQLVATLARQLGGQLAVQSGRGARFEIAFPERPEGGERHAVDSAG